MKCPPLVVTFAKRFTSNILHNIFLISIPVILLYNIIIYVMLLKANAHIRDLQELSYRQCCIVEGIGIAVNDTRRNVGLGTVFDFETYSRSDVK